MLVKEDHQLSFENIPFYQFLYNENEPLEKLNDAINWKKLLVLLEPFYHKTRGRPTKLLRAKIGTYIIKRLLNLSDRNAVKHVRVNIYAQRFCNLHPSNVRNYLNPKNGLSDFRSQIGPEGMAIIDEVLMSIARKKSLKKGRDLIIDSTCVPADIYFPTDIKLLERCRKHIIKLIKQAKKFGLDVYYRTRNRTV